MRAFCGLLLIFATACGQDEARGELPAPDASVPDASDDAAAANRGVEMSMEAPRAATLLYFVPQDQNSLGAAAALGLSVYDFEPGRDRSELLRELAAALELVRWPSAEVLPAEVRFDATLAAYTQQVTLQPSSALSEGDYALRLRSMPARVQLGAIGSELIDGMPTSRFHVGSRPLVTRIELCSKSDAKTKILVEFSEPVGASSSAMPSLLVRADDATLACEQLSLSGAGVETLCPWQAAANVSVRFVSFAGLTGAALRSEAGGEPSYTFSPASLPELVEGCKVFIPWRATK